MQVGRRIPQRQGVPRGDELRVPFVDLQAQYQSIAAEVHEAIERVLMTSAFVLGPDVKAFEDEFAAYCGAKHCVGLESGTAALKLALLAVGIGPGDEVIVPANTYIATALAVVQAGAKPVLVDMDDSYLLDAELAEAAITPRTKALLPVHLYGRAASMAPIMALAKNYGLAVIEDAAQAHGATLDGTKRAGSLGDAACFSFYPGKNLGAYGDGGAVVTNRDDVADKIRLLRDFGQRVKYEHLIKGDNCRIDTIQAAVLRVKLRRLDEWNERRRAAAARYGSGLQAIGLCAPVRAFDGSDVYHLYVIEIPERDAARSRLAASGIQTGVHYPIPIHLQPAFADLALSEGSFPKTERAAKRLLSLPMFPELTDEQIQSVLTALSAHLACCSTSGAR